MFVFGGLGPARLLAGIIFLTLAGGGLSSAVIAATQGLLGATSIAQATIVLSVVPLARVTGVDDFDLGA